MSFVDHLEELRWHIVRSLIVIHRYSHRDFHEDGFLLRYGDLGSYPAQFRQLRRALPFQPLDRRSAIRFVFQPFRA